MRLYSLAAITFAICGAATAAEPIPCGGAHAILASDYAAAKTKVAVRETIKGGGITFNLAYKQGSGFDDSTAGSAAASRRRALVQSVLVYIDSVLDETGAVDIDFEPFTLNPQALALASTFYLPQGPFDGGLAFRHITTGVDAVGNQVPDIQVQVNFAQPFNDDLTDPTQGEFDLYSVLLHELTHGIGMNSLSDANGASLLTQSKAFTTYDNLLFTTGGAKMWSGNPATLQVSKNFLTGGDGSIEFRGAQTTSIFGSAPDVYTPSQFFPSTSVNHWALNTEQLGRRAIMNPSFPPSQKFREYAPFEIRMLQDIGYDIEPGALITPSPTATLTPTPTATATPTVSPTRSIAPTASPSATPSPTRTPFDERIEIVLRQLLGLGTGATDRMNDGVIDAADLKDALDAVG